MLIKEMPVFSRAYKKLSDDYQREVDEAIRRIRENPNHGERKKGDLSNVYVYKFKIHHQEFLLAYEFDESQILLLMLDTHQNFYKTLKRML